MPAHLLVWQGALDKCFQLSRRACILSNQFLVGRGGEKGGWRKRGWEGGEKKWERSEEQEKRGERYINIYIYTGSKISRSFMCRKPFANLETLGTLECSGSEPVFCCGWSAPTAALSPSPSPARRSSSAVPYLYDHTHTRTHTHHVSTHNTKQHN